MPVAIGPRFILEAGFLILLAVVVGLADQSPAVIILVMAVGWLLVALIEYFAWRQTAGVAAMGRTAMVEAAPPGPAPPAPIQEELVEEVAPPPPPASRTPAPPPAGTSPPAAPPAEEETIVVPPEGEKPPVVLEDATEFRQEREISHRLEPLQPRPRRRWIVFGPRERSASDRPEER